MTGGTNNQILLANGGTTDIGYFLPNENPYTLNNNILQSISTLIDKKMLGYEQIGELEASQPIGGVSTLEYNWVITSQFDGTGTWLRDAPFQVQKDDDYQNINRGIYIDRDYTLLKFNGQTVGITTAKSGVLHTGDYVVGLNQGSLVLHSSSIDYFSAYLHWTSQGGSTNIPVTVVYVDDEFIPKFSGLRTMQHLTASSRNTNQYLDCIINQRSEVIINSNYLAILPSPLNVEINVTYFINFGSN